MVNLYMIFQVSGKICNGEVICHKSFITDHILTQSPPYMQQLDFPLCLFIITCFCWHNCKGPFIIPSKNSDKIIKLSVRHWLARQFDEISCSIKLDYVNLINK